jgi:hypothetical protein
VSVVDLRWGGAYLGKPSTLGISKIIHAVPDRFENPNNPTHKPEKAGKK